MAELPSRQHIRATLRGTVTQAKRQVKRAVQRWLPIDDVPLMPPHHAHLTGDGQMCCPQHGADFERTARPLRWSVRELPPRIWTI
jgi:hypothetical protein